MSSRQSAGVWPWSSSGLRQQRARPVADALHAWLTEQRQKLAKADATTKAIDYALR